MLDRWRRKCLRVLKPVGLLILIVTCLIQDVAADESYPARPVVLVVPVQAGGLTDVLGRILADGLSKRLKGPVIVENRQGAGGTLGTASVARAAPDGYSLVLVFQGPVTVAPFLYSNLSYDVFREFVPIAMVGTFPNAIAVATDLPVKSAADLIALAKARPDELTFGSAGVGATSHLAGELFARSAGIKLTHIPYRGEAAALTDVMAGRVSMVFGSLSAIRPLAESGKVRNIGVTTAERSAFAPGLQTVAESGLPGFEVVGWYGVLAPAKTPPGIIERLRNELSGLLSDPDVKARLYEIGVDPKPVPADGFEKWMRDDAAKWRALIEQAGIKAE